MEQEDDNVKVTLNFSTFGTEQEELFFNVFFKFAVAPEETPQISLTYKPGDGLDELFQTPFDILVTGMKPVRTFEQKEVLRWRAYAQQLAFMGEIEFSIEWTSVASGEKHSASFTFPAGERLNQPLTDKILLTHCPELGKLLNSAAPPTVEESAGSLADKVVEIAEYVYKQLSGGLGAVWLSDPNLPTTEDGKALSEANPANLSKEEELEECWAQVLSEYLVATSYAGPPTYRSRGVSGKTDFNIFQHAIENDDPAVSIIYACQHLCIMAAISRGFDDAAGENSNHLYDAASGAAVRNWSQGDGSGAVETASSLAVAKTAIDQGKLRPGAAYVASNTRHIAFVVRVFKNGQLQMIDTGAMTSSPGHSNPFGGVLGGLSSGSNYDTIPVNQITRPMKHLAVMPKTNRLAHGIARLKKSRPMGFARMIVLKRGTETETRRLIYASPLLPMWEADEHLNYPVTHYMWSLRGHPYKDELEVQWMIQIPQYLTGDDSDNPAYDRAINHNGRDFTWPEDKLDSTRAGLRTFPTMRVGSTEEGKVRPVEGFKTEVVKEEKTVIENGESVVKEEFVTKNRWLVGSAKNDTPAAIWNNLITDPRKKTLSELQSDYPEYIEIDHDKLPSYFDVKSS